MSKIPLKQDTGNFNHITRNDNIIVFYNKMDILGFLSAYVIYKWLEKHEMLEKAHFIPVIKNSDLYVDYKTKFKGLNNFIVFFIDIDFTEKLYRYHYKYSKRIDLFDNKESTENARKNLPKFLIKNLFYFQRKSFNILHLVYRAFVNDIYPGEFLALDNYKQDIFDKNFNDYLMSLPYSYGNSFESVDNFFEQKKHKNSLHNTNSKNIVTINIAQTINIVYANNSLYQIDNIKILVINAPLEMARFIYAVVLSKPEIDICICYTEIDDIYYYKIKTDRKDLNLFSLFNKFKPFGNKDLIWFNSKKKITDNFKKVI